MPAINLSLKCHHVKVLITDVSVSCVFGLLTTRLTSDARERQTLNARATAPRICQHEAIWTIRAWYQNLVSADFFSSLPAFCLFLTAEPGSRLDQVDSLIHETRKRQIPTLSRQTAWQYNSQYGPEHDFYPGITWKGPARSGHFYTEIGSSVHVSRLVYSPCCMASVITWKISSRDTGITTGIPANRAGSVTKLIFIAFN